MAATTEDDERLLFVYGSNMASRYIKQVCSSARAVMRAELANHTIEFRRYSTTFKGGVCTVMPAPGRLVRGVVYRVLAHELDALDEFGDLASGLYRRETYLVLGEDRFWHTADLHRAVRPGAAFPPAPGYVALMLEGAREHGLDPDYVNRLETLLEAGSGRAAADP
jgi:gamma-glutamylcyclotransferase